MNPADPRHRLLDVIGGIAAYNDKGYQWSGHGAEQVLLSQQEAQRTIMQLVAEIGEQRFSPNLLDKLASGEAARDGNGDIYLLAKQELS